MFLVRTNIGSGEQEAGLGVALRRSIPARELPPVVLRLYDALTFLARGDVLSSDDTTPLVAPPTNTRKATLDRRILQLEEPRRRTRPTSGRLTSGRFPFGRFALGADRLPLGGLGLAVLPPLLQLEVDEFPHHPGLCEADSGQAGHPGEGRGLSVGGTSRRGTTRRPPSA